MDNELVQQIVRETLAQAAAAPEQLSFKETVPQLIHNYFWPILVTASIIYLIFSGQLRRFAHRLTGFRKARLGPVEIDIGENENFVAACPHTKCGELRDKTTKKMWEKIDNLNETDKKLVETLEKIDGHLCELQKEVRVAFEKLDELTIDQLKLVFYNESMPDAERLISGLRYVAKGFNHDMREDTIAFGVEKLPMYEAAIAAAPKLRLLAIEEQARILGLEKNGSSAVIIPGENK